MAPTTSWTSTRSAGRRRLGRRHDRIVEREFVLTKPGSAPGVSAPSWRMRIIASIIPRQAHCITFFTRVNQLRRIDNLRLRPSAIAAPDLPIAISDAPQDVLPTPSTSASCYRSLSPSPASSRARSAAPELARSSSRASRDGDSRSAYEEARDVIEGASRTAAAQEKQRMVFAWSVAAMTQLNANTRRNR